MPRKAVLILFVAGCIFFPVLVGLLGLALVRGHLLPEQIAMIALPLFAFGLPFLAYLLIDYLKTADESVAEPSNARVVMGRLARKFRGKVVDSGFVGSCHLQFAIGPHSADLFFVDSVTCLVVDLRGQSHGSLHIVPGGWSGLIARLQGLQDLKVGDDSFDKDYIVRARPESLIAGLFGGSGRGRLLDSIRRIPDLKSIDLLPHSLSIRSSGYLMHSSKLDFMIEAARTLVSVLQETDFSGIHWEEEESLSGGQCQVCLGKMQEGVVGCAKCRTPHHRSCWEYIGACSTYGCRETRFETISG